MANELLPQPVVYGSNPFDSSTGIGGRFGTIFDGIRKTANDLGQLVIEGAQTVGAINREIDDVRDTVRNTGDNRDGATVAGGVNLTASEARNYLLLFALALLIVYLVTRGK